MNTTTSDTLLARLLDLAADPAEPVIAGLATRPVFLLAPHSLLGTMHGQAIASRLPNVVAAVDDVSREPTIHGVPRWSSVGFLQRAAQYPDALALDFSAHAGTRAMFDALCRAAAVERRDCVVAQAALGLVSVYETVSTYRQKTLDRLDDFLALAERFSDDHSRATLYAHLLFRLSYDRSHLLDTWTTPAEEYFSPYAQASTFRLGLHEHYCDAGAFQGPIVAKFLGATRHRYESITAFEPDRTNYAALTQVSPLPLRNFRPVNKAVSSRKQMLRFMETGTVSSYVSAEGTVNVETARLDDELSDLTFLKMDVEGFEARTLQGAAGLIRSRRPRIAACVYHYAHDLLDVVAMLDKHTENYHLRLRQHYGSYYYDLVLYASPIAGVEAPAWAA